MRKLKLLSKLNSTSTYGRLLGYLRPYKIEVTWTLLSMIILAITEPAIPALMQPMLDGSFINKDPDMIRLIPMALVLLALVRGLAMFGSDFGLQWVATRVITDLRNTMFQRLLSLPTAFYDTNPSGHIISKLTYDVNNVSNAVTQAVLVLVRDSLAVVGLLILMVYLDWLLSLIAIIIVPAVGLVIHHMGARLRQLSQAQQHAMGHMTHILEEAIKGHKIVKIFAGVDYETVRYQQAAEAVRHLVLQFAFTGNLNSVIVHVVSSIALAAIVYYAALMSAEGKLTAGEFVAFFGAMALLLNPIKRLTKVNEQIQMGLAAAMSVFELIDQATEADCGTLMGAWVGPTSKDMQQASNLVSTANRGEIELRGVSLRYPNSDYYALQDINIHIQPNETVALVGASGSGKSSLANLLPRLYVATTGQVIVDGIDSCAMTLAALRRYIALVSQEVVLFNDTIAANIAYGSLAHKSATAVEQAAQAAHASEFIRQWPQQFATVIGENGVRLSGGQRQRLAIARAILKDAPIMIFDEATSALDAESERLVQEAINRLHGNRTLLLIAHRLSTVRHADRIIVLDHGRIVETGTHQELLTYGGVYANLYRQVASST